MTNASQNMHRCSPDQARAAGRKARHALSDAQRHRFSRQLCRKLKSHRWYLRARSIAFYIAAPTEVDLGILIAQACADGKQALVPCVQPQRQMRFARIEHNTRWKQNRYGLSEPVRQVRYAHKRVSSSDIDLFCVPLTAFDAQFNRVGMGGGYYDHYFGTNTLGHSSKRIGIGFSVQEVAAIDNDEWDVAMHGIATERGVATMRQQRTQTLRTSQSL